MAFYCVAVCGQGSVSVATVVTTNNTTQIERNFQQLNVTNAKFALMFFSIYKETEISLFKKVFPATPLFGVCGSRCIGIDSSRNRPRILDADASVFLIVSFP